MVLLVSLLYWCQTKIQVIEIRADFYPDMTKFIDEHFDFDFCKTIFDGVTVNVLYPNSVLAKTCIIDCNGLYIREDRLKKYRKRGFSIEPKYNMYDQFVKFVETEKLYYAIKKQLLAVIKDIEKYDIALRDPIVYNRLKYFPQEKYPPLTLCREVYEDCIKINNFFGSLPKLDITDATDNGFKETAQENDWSYESCYIYYNFIKHEMPYYFDKFSEKQCYEEYYASSKTKIEHVQNYKTTLWYQNMKK